MNPRRVHELIRVHFATTGVAKMVWTNLVDERVFSWKTVVLLEQFVQRGVEEVLIEVRRKFGDQLPVSEVIPFL
jgi:hypothetical protein